MARAAKAGTSFVLYMGDAIKAFDKLKIQKNGNHWKYKQQDWKQQEKYSNTDTKEPYMLPK